MADKKLVDLTLKAPEKTDEIYVVRDGTTDARVKLSDIIVARVAQPVNTSPANSATGIAFKPELTASSYSPLYDSDVRLHRTFQVTLSSDVDFANPVVNVNVNADNFALSVDLQAEFSYIWRCRDISAGGFESEWSVATGFTTKAGDVVKPSVTSPTAGRTDVKAELFTSSTFAVTGGSDTLSGSEWELYSGGVLVHSSGLVNGSVNYKFPEGVLVVLTDYEVRVRHVGVAYGISEWSDYVAFTTDSVLSYENYLAVAHATTPCITIYGRDVDANIKLDNPAALPASGGNGVAFSADGTYMAVCSVGSPFIAIYKRSGDTFTKLPNPTSLPAGIANGVAFSVDGTYMVVAHNNSPFITVYKRSGDTFTKLSNPTALPAGIGYGVAFSTDGTYIAVAHWTTPYTTIYKRSGDTFTKLSDPTALPTYTGYGVAFSVDGTYMAVATAATPFVIIYKRSGDTFTKLPNPAALPAGAGFHVAFSADGTYMAVAHATTPFVTIYKRSGDTFTKLANPAALPTDTGRGVAFSANGTYMAVAHNSSPYTTIYKRSGDTFTKLPNPAALPAGTGRGVAFYPSALYGPQ